MSEQTVVGYFDSREPARAAQSALAEAGFLSDLMPADNAAPYARADGENAYDASEDRGGFWAALSKYLLPDEDRYSYAEGLSRGGVMLAIGTTSEEFAQVAEILHAHGSVNIEERAAEWETYGWTGYQAAKMKGSRTGDDLRSDRQPPSHAWANVRSYAPSRPVAR